MPKHNPDNDDCPLNDPETFANPVTAGLPCGCEEIGDIMTPEQKALYYFTMFMDGTITETELISMMAALPPEVIKAIPQRGESWIKPEAPSFRDRVLALQGAIAEGRTVVIGS